MSQFGAGVSQSVLRRQWQARAPTPTLDSKDEELTAPGISRRVATQGAAEAEHYHPARKCNYLLTESC